MSRFMPRLGHQLADDHFEFVGRLRHRLARPVDRLGVLQGQLDGPLDLGGVGLGHRGGRLYLREQDSLYVYDLKG